MYQGVRKKPMRRLLLSQGDESTGKEHTGLLTIYIPQVVLCKRSNMGAAYRHAIAIWHTEPQEMQLQR